ncbi:MotA/TolQ/ExbB proton channel family protein [Gammaproteobacteria bacterium]|jgi:biopolymer transport protein ExbB|nr:MotA/TolQ/ExbB proton channel family protein [Pseudomonadota bacterium]MDC1284913.1 MotA/TolQ/ExbB proton channel family protein [Gammaproteobacteria bacterium]
MLEIIQSGGWMIWPILLSSVIALGIIFERFWSLRQERIMPQELVKKMSLLQQQSPALDADIEAIHGDSAFASIVKVAIQQRTASNTVQRERLEEVGRQIVHELQLFLTTLGTIAVITPLLGLLGTVLGMIDVFMVMSSTSVTEPEALAGGIAQALITTAAGISVAIPSLIFVRYFRRKVADLVLQMETQAILLIDRLAD